MSEKITHLMYSNRWGRGLVKIEKETPKIYFLSNGVQIRKLRLEKGAVYAHHDAFDCTTYKIPSNDDIAHLNKIALMQKVLRYLENLSKLKPSDLIEKHQDVIDFVVSKMEKTSEN